MAALNRVVPAAVMTAALLALAAPAAAQLAPDSSQQAFVQTVRDATERYRDRAAAIADGYRPIGPDFPSMGEHWISVPLLLKGKVDPARPPILEYATIEGQVTLVGAAFAVLLKAGEQPPSGEIPVPGASWHHHSGTVSEESFVASHASGAHRHGNGPSIAVLHVWAWYDNPDGPFATDNWALPFARLGLPIPARKPNSDAWNAIALAAGGEQYYQALLAVTSGEPTDSAAQLQLGLAASGLRQLLARGATEPDTAARRWQALREALPGLP